jgi:hypothetical protein
VKNRHNLRSIAGVIRRTSKESYKALNEHEKSRLNKYVQMRFNNLWIVAKSINDADNLYASFSDDEKQVYGYNVIQRNQRFHYDSEFSSHVIRYNGVRIKTARTPANIRFRSGKS